MPAISPPNIFGARRPRATIEMAVLDYLKCIQQEKTTKLTPMVRLGNRTYRLGDLAFVKKSQEKPITKQPCRFHLLLRWSGISANISNKWQDFLLFIFQLKRVVFSC